MHANKWISNSLDAISFEHKGHLTIPVCRVREGRGEGERVGRLESGREWK